MLPGGAGKLKVVTPKTSDPVFFFFGLNYYISCTFDLRSTSFVRILFTSVLLDLNKSSYYLL